jgi:tetrapyrrole methylase family protein/MazG family protein
MMTGSGITLLGLGPGDPGSLTRQAWDLINSAREIYLRTRHHPVVTSFPGSLRIHSYDHLYDSNESYEQVYNQIIEDVLRLGQRPVGVIYAVPGHPFIAEATAPEIARRGREAQIPIRIVEGISFIESTFTAIGKDPFPQTVIIDALDLAVAHHPPFPPDAPALIAQIHSPSVASDVKLTLLAIYPDTHSVQLVHGAGTPEELVEILPLYQIDRSTHIGMVTSLYVPALAPHTSFESFQELIAHLRAPEGCPWDREQTHQSLRPHLMEEAYEVLVALDEDDPQAMSEEFGDLLLQIVLHAQIASEFGEFSMTDILSGIHEKIIRRHPHVFGDLSVKDKETVLTNWELLKADERKAGLKKGDSLFDGVSLALPALVQADTYQKRAARVGFDWQNVQGVIDKVREEIREIQGAETKAEYEDEIGDLLFSIVNLARWSEIDAESALRRANIRFRKRFMSMEAQARLQGRTLQAFSTEELDALWEIAKDNEEKSG